MPGVCCDEESLEEGHPVLLPLCKVEHCQGAHQHVVCSFQLQGEGRGKEGRGGEGRGGEGGTYHVHTHTNSPHIYTHTTRW